MLLATLISILPFVPGFGSVGDAPDNAPAAGAKAGKSAKAAKKVDPFAEATRLKRSATGKSLEEKQSALTAAAQECERVAKSAAEPPVLAEAHWRAGEIWRTLKHEEDARRCFSSATRLAAADPRIAAKAWLELGHLDRRAKRWDVAIESYRQVMKVMPEQRKEAAQSLTWQGKALLGKGDAAGGHALLLAVGTRYPELPLEDIRNVDTVACDWIEAGRRDEARELVASCDERHAEDDSTGEDDDDREAIARALGRMKAKKLLAETATRS